MLSFLLVLLNFRWPAVYRVLFIERREVFSTSHTALRSWSHALAAATEAARLNGRPAEETL